MTKRKPNKAFMKPLKISPELESVIGKGPMSRGTIMKKLWAYIKKYDLQHPKNRRCIVLDEELSEVFKPTRSTTKVKVPKGCVSMFDIASQLTKHIDAGTPTKKSKKVQKKKNPARYAHDSFDDEDEDKEYEYANNPHDEDEDEDEEYEYANNPYDEDEEEDEEEDY